MKIAKQAKRPKRTTTTIQPIPWPCRNAAGKNPRNVSKHDNTLCFHVFKFLIKLLPGKIRILEIICHDRCWLLSFKCTLKTLDLKNNEFHKLKCKTLQILIVISNKYKTSTCKIILIFLSITVSKNLRRSYGVLVFSTIKFRQFSVSCFCFLS